jgi:predicted phosphodiesterase
MTLITLLLPALLMAQQIEIVNGPYLQNMSENETTIVWTTNSDAVSWVELAPEGEDSFYAKERERFYESSHGNKAIGRLHRVTIGNLEPGTTYRYRIFSKEVLSYEGHRIMYGNIASTNVYNKQPLTFTTFDRNRERIAFKVVNDIHGKNDNLSSMLGGDIKKNSDLVIFNGDMISMLNDERQIFTGFMDRATELFASEVPVFLARGNHESRGKASSQLIDYFPTNNGQFYYAFRHGPVHFMILDGGEDKPDSDIEYSGLSLFDDYRSEVKRWIEKQAADPDFLSAPFRVVVMHIPPTGSTWHGTLDLADKYLPALNGARIDIMLCGHTHNYLYTPGGEVPGISFPVLINDDETWLDIETTQEKMTIDIMNLSGKRVTSHTIDRR